MNIFEEKKLGFGCMRMPVFDAGKPDSFDYEKIEELFDTFLEQVYYNNIALNGHGKAGECIKCGKCEQACPQHLPIREYLEQVAGKFENDGFFPTRAKD